MFCIRSNDHQHHQYVLLGFLNHRQQPTNSNMLRRYQDNNYHTVAICYIHNNVIIYQYSLLLFCDVI